MLIKINSVKIAYISLFLIYFQMYFWPLPFQSENLSLDLADTEGGSLIRQLLILSSVFLLFLTREKIQIKKIIPFLVFIAFIFCSIFWADHFNDSIRRILRFALVSYVAIKVASILSFEQLSFFTARFLAYCVIISILSCFLIPSAVHGQIEMFDSELIGAWRGVFSHKNTTGSVAAMSLIFSMYYLIKSSDKKFWSFMLFLSLLLLVMSKSKSSLGFVIISFLLAYTSYILASKKWLNSVLLNKLLLNFVIIIMPLCLIIYLDSLHNYFSLNPESFTGRGTLWAMLLQMMDENFWLGKGYGSVWRVGEDMALATYAEGWVDWVFLLTTGHNGYFDTFASLGIVGYLLCLYVFGFILLKKIHDVGNLHSMYFLISLVSFFYLHNLFETDLLNTSNGLWLIFLTFYVSVCFGGIDEKNNSNYTNI